MLRYIQSQTQWLSGASVSQCTHWLRHISTHLHCHSTTTLRPFLHSKPGANDKSMGIVTKSHHDKQLISSLVFMDTTAAYHFATLICSQRLPHAYEGCEDRGHCRHTSQMGSACHQKTGATWLHLGWISARGSTLIFLGLGSGSATGTLCMIHPWSWLLGSPNCDWDSSSWVVMRTNQKEY